MDCLDGYSGGRGPLNSLPLLGNGLPHDQPRMPSGENHKTW